MKKKKKMKVPIGIPINQAQKGERFYISINDILFVQKEKKDKNDIEKIEDDFEIWVYISKIALLSRLSINLGDVPIKKIGTGMKGEDFFIDFSDYFEKINLTPEEIIKENLYLAPAKADYYYPDEECFEEDSSRENQSTNTDKESSQTSITKKNILEEKIEEMPKEQLIVLDSSYKDLLDTVDCMSDEKNQKFYRWLIDLVWFYSDRRKKALESVTQKSLEKMTPQELDSAYEEAKNKEDYETCGKILGLLNAQGGDKTNSNRENQTGGLYHPVLLYGH